MTTVMRRIERGCVLRFWKENGFRAQVHPATLFVRRDLLTALHDRLGDLPGSGSAARRLHGRVPRRPRRRTGWFSAEMGLLYRKWEGQVTGQAPHVDPAERDARMAVVEARARALADFAWTYPAGG